MIFKVLTIAVTISTVVAQRPTNVSICDFYTTALLENNTAANQKTLLTLVVNTAVIGNYTTPNVGITVPGILASNATFNGTAVDLVPYFSGGLASTNTGKFSGMSVNFLDGGGAAPLMMNMAANSTTSNQYILLTHLYEYFGALLGCSQQGTSDYPAYSAQGSMYEVHKFMDLSAAEVGYFIEQVGLSAASFGVATEDLQGVGTALNTLFGYKCAPAATVIPSQGPQLQAICIDDTCPTSPNATCDAYNITTKPVPSNSSNIASTTISGTTTATGTTSGTASTPAQATTNSGAVSGLSMVAVAGGIMAFFL